ncbi:MAG TPA: Gfo/Idh/MocA family oxidoreductase [Candidatus Brocadiia bacterium]|nr:Gfo/Idh/MocA family oxidoreductase [Candidatus Brocadiia bacterium]
MAAKVKLGFVGAGYMGQLAHLANYAQLPDCELVALAEGRPKLAELVATRYGVAKVYPDHKTMLKEADVEAVVAILPYSLHDAIIPDLLKAGKHVITEKPICCRVANAKKISKLAKKNGVIYHVGYMKRCDPASVRGKAMIAEWKKSGECGPLRYLRVTMPPGPWNLTAKCLSSGEPFPGYDGQKWEGLPDDMPEADAQLYNAFINYYIHQINLIRYLLGEDYKVTYADPKGVTFTAMSDSGVVIVLEMAPYQCPDHWEETYKACFEKGWIQVDLPAPLQQYSGSLACFRGAEKYKSSESRIYVNTEWAMFEQARMFVAEVRGEQPLISPSEDAVKDLEVAVQYVKALRASQKAK